MASIKEIVEIENKKSINVIILWQEGTFFRAYEKSAYYIAQKKGFKVLAKFYKNINQYVVYVGFPMSSLKKHYPQATVVQEKPCIVRVELQDGFDAGFEKWKETILRHDLEKEESRQEADSTRYDIPHKDEISLVHDSNYYAQSPIERTTGAENLPVFKLIFDLLKRIIEQSMKLTRDYRYTIGEDLKKTLLKAEVLVVKVYQAKSIADKLAMIDQIKTHLIEVKIYLRVLRESRQLSLRKYALDAKDLVDIEHHIHEWNKYYTNKS